jgi:hypothetical protein
MLNILCHCHVPYLSRHCRWITSHLTYFVVKQFAHAGKYCCTKNFRSFSVQGRLFKCRWHNITGMFHLGEFLTVYDIFLHSNICQHCLWLDPLHMSNAFHKSNLWSVVMPLLHVYVTNALWHEIFILKFKFKFIACIHNNWSTYALLC